MKYSIVHICGILQGEFLQQYRDDVIEHLLLDSRRLIFPDDSLFFALKGPRRDAHLFIEELYKRGVRNFIVESGWKIPEDGLPGSGRPGGEASGGEVSGSGLRGGEASGSAMHEANIIAVDDTLAALQMLAAYHRSQFTLPVIGITGSNGKTIVKEWLNQLLEDEFHIVRSPKSYNSQIGVPLSVWQLNESHGLAIFEAGISRPEEMQRLEAIIRPTIGLFTNIGEAHSEGFVSLAAKAEEKARLFDHAQVIVYRDQPELRLALAHSPAEHFSWGHDEAARLVILSIEKKEGGTAIRARHDSQVFSLSIPFTDEASIENSLHCVCVLLWLGQTPDQIGAKLQGLSGVSMRLELKSGVNQCSIINDSYSADTNSLRIALDFLSQQHQHPRCTVILSDILESGRKEEDLYGEIAGALRQKKVDRLVGIGPRIGAHAAVFDRLFDGEAVFYPSVEAFKNDLFQLHFRDETILLKGARVFEFERIDHLLSGQIHQTVMEINLDAMAHNLRQYRQLLQPSTKLMAMVKAFAYGSGSFEIANLLQFHQVDYLGVAYADEGVALRRAGIRMPIMVMNAEDSAFDMLLQYNLEPVLFSFSLLHAFDRWLKKQGVEQFPVHIELETGMNRLGFSLNEINELIREMSHSRYTVQSVFSHLAASEEPRQDAFTFSQAALFSSAAGRLQDALGHPFLRHIANTAAITRHPQLQLDMVRLGIGLYGVDSAAAPTSDPQAHGASALLLDLREVSTLKSTIAQIKYLSEGDTIGYNRRGIAASGMVIATVRIGYADGYPRSLGNGAGKMWINGRLAPVTGSVCMDMTMIDITGIPGVKEGDEVVVFGKELSVRQLAQWGQTIPYEILAGVSQRVRRVYFEE